MDPPNDTHMSKAYGACITSAPFATFATLSVQDQRTGGTPHLSFIWAMVSKPTEPTNCVLSQLNYIQLLTKPTKWRIVRGLGMALYAQTQEIGLRPLVPHFDPPPKKT